MNYSGRDLMPGTWPSWIVAGLATFMVVNHYRDRYFFWPKYGIKQEFRSIPIISEFYNILTKCRFQHEIDKRMKYGKLYASTLMGERVVYVCDAEIIKQIAVKDFDLFPDHPEGHFDSKYHRNSLVWIKGDQWRHTRAMMTPSFTSGKIKRMFKLMDVCANDLVENFRENYIKARRNGDSCAVVDLVEIYEMYTMDGLTTCCYGIKLKREQQINSKTSHKSNTRDNFVTEAKVFFDNKLHRLFIRLMVPQPILRMMNFTVFRDKELEPITGRLRHLIDRRRETGEKNKYDDLLQLLTDASADDKLELNEIDEAENHHAGLTHESLEQDQKRLREKSAEDRTKKRLTDFEILSEALFVLSAGLDTTKALLSSMTYYLAHNQNVQERLFEELKSIAEYRPTPSGKELVFEYDSLTSCKYLDAVISETLRICPSLTYTDREVMQDYYIEKYDVTIPKGVTILFGIYAAHMDPDYWEEPEKFDPDRFMPGRKEKIVPGSYLPFSIGPRHCIGMRFSLTETKLGLAKALMNFKFEPAPGTKYPPRSTKKPNLVDIENCKARVLLRE